ncbi:MAG: DNA alkylation repair protein [Lachnospiraceae bacterium]|nr:DNA alkylation repair protein [Lachnospiraceae bacterium]
MRKITESLLKMRDARYGDFQSALMPTVEKKTIIGIKTPRLKAYAKELSKEAEKSKDAKRQLEKYLNALPHKYFDENQLHDFLIAEIKEFDECIEKVEAFLPYVDNWATCDQLSPNVFKKNKQELLNHIKKWIKSKEPYTVRFAVGMLMEHFLDEDYDKKYLEMVTKIKYKAKGKSCDKINVKTDPDKYYVEMMRAWYFATALAKQYEDSYMIIKNKKLNLWTHNKTIQKAIESYRISDKHKSELKKLLMK